MKIKNIFICTAVALLVTACGTTEIAKREFEHREKVFQILADHQKKTEESIREVSNRHAARLVDYKIEQEKTKQAEANAKVVQAGSLQIIAAKAGKEGAAAIGAVLASGLNNISSNTTVAQADPKVEIPQVPALKLPEFAPIKTPAQEAKEWAGIFLAGVSTTVNPVFGYLSAKSGNAANVAINRDNRAADAANYANLMGTFGRFSDNQANTANAVAQTVRDLQPNVNVTTNGNDNAVALFNSRAVRSTKECNVEQTQTAQSGNSGQSGATGATGTVSVNAPGSATSGSSAPSGATGTTGQTSPAQTNECKLK